jgi:hypothetical protein
MHIDSIHKDHTLHYVPLGFSFDEAPPRVPALGTLRGEPMNFAAIGVAAARLGRAASKDKDMRVREWLVGHGGKIEAGDGSTRWVMTEVCYKRDCE